ncbi:phosphoribosylformylglycinamidine synthase subunit PurS [Salicibibacter cibarius]|uniref:Phosphoribosylformylglycinamidine synthase subunit PurS n=1 Tax=Salicibibacter cibarius TaxID=2743000 RepID=A0A7T7CAX1_9BACI|nr:phosphoribosylformylglycinamidine synthase subunit PurS [Salicibibacter cibarius]QQK75347.1 phosphoribosylformylglycinamidine synthase subunit PurS [Salicibibacter cibarius]
MINVHVYITLKEGVLDPQGQAVQRSLAALGYEEVDTVNVGKWLKLEIVDGPDVETRVEQMCEQLLANPVIENYTYTLEREEKV